MIDAVKRYFSDLLSLDSRSLSIFRILLGVLVLIDLLIRISDLELMYTDTGIFPNEITKAMAKKKGYWSLHFLDGSFLYQGLLFTAHIISALFLCIGYKTRVATFVCWILTISLQNRNIFVQLGGYDRLMRLMLFWATFLPTYTRYSIDSRLSSYKIPNETVSKIATLGFTFQLFFLYFWAGLLKKNPDWEVTSNAIYWVLSAEWYSTNLGKQLLHYPELLKHLSKFTWVFEVVCSFFIIIPYKVKFFRIAVVVLFSYMHLAFAMGMTLWLFTALNICTLVALLPSYFWDCGKFGKILDSSRITQNGPSQDHHSIFNRTTKKIFNTTGLILASVGLFIIIAYNIFPSRRDIPIFIKKPAFFLGLNQHWHLFSNIDPLYRIDNWFLIIGIDAEGQRINAYNPSQPIPYEKPENIWRTFKNNRWRRVLNRMVGWVHAQKIRKKYLSYLCDKGNGKYKKVEFYTVMKRNYESNQETLPVHMLLGSIDCLPP